MCELTFVNAHSLGSNRAIAYGLAFVNGQSNKDGTGFAYNGRVWKSKYGGAMLINLSTAIRERVVGNLPVMVHTRAASTGINNAKIISEANSHPFEGERYILMHNGTLSTKAVLTKEERDAYGSITDSELFLKKLEACPEEDFITAFNATMDLFTGKYAFIIYDKKQKAHYIVRGSTATLFKVPLKDDENKVIGYAINTGKNDLIMGLVLASNLNSNFDFSVEEIVELPKETIFLAEDLDIKEVGKCKENFFTAATQAHTGTTTALASGSHTGVDQRPLLPAPSTGNSTGTNGTGTTKISNTPFLRRMFRLGLDHREIDLFIRKVCGKGLLSLNEQDWAKLNTAILNMVNGQCTKRHVYLWGEIRKYTLGFDYIAYQGGIPFPYFMAEISTLEYALIQLQKEEKNANSKIAAARSVFGNGQVCDAECTDSEGSSSDGDGQAVSDHDEG